MVLSYYTALVSIFSIDTNVDVRVEASNDGGDNYFNANLDQGPTDYTRYTANGVYTLEMTNRSYTHVRFRFVDEDGGAAVTLDAELMACN